MDDCAMSDVLMYPMGRFEAPYQNRGMSSGSIFKIA